MLFITFFILWWRFLMVFNVFILSVAKCVFNFFKNFWFKCTEYLSSTNIQKIINSVKWMETYNEITISQTKHRWYRSILSGELLRCLWLAEQKLADQCIAAVAYTECNTDYVDNATTDTYSHIETHTHTHPFNGHLSRTIQVSRYQKGKTNLDFTEARDSEWQ